MDQDKYSTLMDYVKDVPDPRSERGKQHDWPFLLAIICAALASGQKTVWAIAGWAKLHSLELLEHLQNKVERVPSASTLYRVLRQIDGVALEGQIAAYGRAVDEEEAQSGRVKGPDGRVLRGQAVDGKEVRGAGTHGAKVHLVSMVRHDSGAILGQRKVADKSNEIRAVPKLLAEQDLAGTVTTFDAMSTQRELAQQILDQDGDYLMVVKGNQPTLWEAIDTLFTSPPLLPGEEDRLAYRHTTKGHGRQEQRTLISSELLNQYLDWPGVGQVIQRICERQVIKSKDSSRKVTYGITSLNRRRALPKQLEAFWRGYWTVENRSHYVRDETMGEDRGQIHQGNSPQALAALRNGIITMFRHQVWSSIAEALRYSNAYVQETLFSIGAIAT